MRSGRIGTASGLDRASDRRLIAVEVIDVRVSALLAVVLVGAVIGPAVSAGDVTVSFLGHSCYTVQAEGGPIVMIDPYGSYVPYPGLPAPADIVLMTHRHIDHCPYCYGESDRVLGDPILVHLWDDAGRCREKLPPAAWVITPEFKTHAIEASHVTRSGGGEGWVCLFSFEVDGIRFAHLSDLGQILTAKQIGALSDVDVLFLPVGGSFTIDPAEAMTVIGQLPSVRIVLPMHYYVDGITPWPSMLPLEDFTSLARTTYGVREIENDHAALSTETLPGSLEVWVLKHKSE